MQYRLLGKSGLRVSELCLGAMTFGEEWGWGANKEESRRIFDAYAGEGGNFIDTANRYTEGTSEKWVGEFVNSDRNHFVVATKYSLYTRLNDPNFSGNHRKNMMQALEESLKRLNTDYVDLYWLHAWDYMTPIEEVMRGLDDLVRAGKVLYVGVSDTPAWIVSRANLLAELRGWTPFVGLQIQYSLIERSVERELTPMARELDLAITPWGALGSGILSGKYNKGKAQGRVAESERLTEKNLKIAEETMQVAEQIGCSASQVALAWVRQQPGVIIPILGARTTDQMWDNMGCLNVHLSPEQLERLDEASAIELGFPYDFLKQEMMNKLLYGGTLNQIVNHRNKEMRVAEREFAHV